MLYADARKSKSNFLFHLEFIINIQVIEQIDIIEKHHSILDDNLLVKAYLRRGLANERLDRILKAREDFYKVKSLDMNNK